MNNHLSNDLDRAGNALIEVSQLYFNLQAFSAKSEPAFVELSLVLADGSMATAILPMSQLNSSGLHQAVPRFLVPRKHRDAFDTALLDEVHRLIAFSSSHLLQSPDGGETCIGYAFTQTGMHQLPNGQYVYVWRDCVLGNCDLPYIVRCSDSVIPKILPLESPLSQLFSELTYSDPQATLAFVYLCATLLRSWITSQVPSWQAVLCLFVVAGISATRMRI